jgi:hypothetical protein
MRAKASSTPARTERSPDTMRPRSATASSDP